MTFGRRILEIAKWPGSTGDTAWLHVGISIAVTTVVSILILLPLAIRAPEPEPDQDQLTEILYPDFMFLLDEEFKIQACLRIQWFEADELFDPQNCIGYPKTPGRKCTPSDACWEYCYDHRYNCGPGGVTYVGSG